jgi:hypothetical protein
MADLVDVKVTHLPNALFLGCGVDPRRRAGLNTSGGGRDPAQNVVNASQNGIQRGLGAAISS